MTDIDKLKARVELHELLIPFLLATSAQSDVPTARRILAKLREIEQLAEGLPAVEAIRSYIDVVDKAIRPPAAGAQSIDP